MKKNQLRKGLMAATLAAGLMSAPTAFANPPAAGDLALSLNPFFEGSVGAPSYSLGYFVSDTVMPYAFIGIEGRDVGDDVFTIGGGVRAYLGGMSDRLRPYAGGAIGIVNAEDTGFGIGAFFGAEAMIVNGFSVSGQVGLDIVDQGCNGCSANVDLGVASAQFNFYF